MAGRALVAGALAITTLNPNRLYVPWPDIIDALGPPKPRTGPARPCGAAVRGAAGMPLPATRTVPGPAAAICVGSYRSQRDFITDILWGRTLDLQRNDVFSAEQYKSECVLFLAFFNHTFQLSHALEPYH